jgi:mono/diheme cytochrome c family protein
MACSCGFFLLAASAMAVVPGVDNQKTTQPTGTKSKQALATPGAGALPDPKEPNRPETATPPLWSRGQELFAKQCAVCHGDAGDGAGKFAYLMNPRPRNFQQGNFKLATTQNQVPSDEDLIRTISRGMPGSAMPPWGHLPLSDLQALATYVRDIRAKAVRESAQAMVVKGELEAAGLESYVQPRITPNSPVVVPAEPVQNDIRWFNGRRLYVEGCASCHGADGQPVADAVKFDAEGYPVPPRSFVSGIFKGGSDGHQLYVRIVKGLKGTPMPASEGNYSNDDIWDLIHYVQSLARAGAQERAQLGQGTFAAPRVAKLPTEPMDSTWSQARPLYVALTPLWWTERRVEGLVVQALHDGSELALRFSWLDPTGDDSAVRHNEFRDAVAVQFSMSSDPPFYMGDKTASGGVNIWMWKADRQANILNSYRDVDTAYPDRVVDYYPEPAFARADMQAVDPEHGALSAHRPEFVTAWGAGNLVADPNLTTPVECLSARGAGTLSGKPSAVQFVRGKAVYERGVWYAQMQRTLEVPHCQEHTGEDERAFRPGDYLPVSFAIWEGGAGDRDGKKNISIWQKLVIE